MASFKGKKMTPLMEQYFSVKKQHLDKVVLFRMGDFFEMFHEDALVAAPILNIALTQRNKKSKDDTPMCGVPHHSIAGPIGRLLAAGQKVAICDQVENPQQAKGIVKRAVTRCLSPGMVYDPDTLDQLEANYLCSYDNQTVAFLEATTGEAFYYQEHHFEEQLRLVKLLAPVEVILSPQQKRDCFERQGLEGLAFSFHRIDSSLLNEEEKKLPHSCQRLLSYALTMQGVELSGTLGSFEARRLEKCLVMSSIVIRHLEIFETYKGEAKGSLFHAVNRTKTSAGARLLKQWLQFPLLDDQEIANRQERVQRWSTKTGELQNLRQVLVGMGDMERRLGKISNPNCSPRDLNSLKNSLQVGLWLRPWCEGKADPAAWKTCQELVEQIEATLVEEPPIKTKSGGLIRRGYDSQLDEWIRLSEDSQALLLKLEAREKQATDIPSLKVRYNNVFGYYIEVTNTHKDKVPGHYLRKQTLTNAERYTTEELQELECKVLAARTKRVDLELEVFAELRKTLLDATADIMGLAREWSELDVLSSLAWLAIEYKYCRPTFSKSGGLQLKASRHPVVEQEVSKGFVPNDIFLNRGETLLLTGPNMAGKSTIMRQVAITAILAQIGSFVPAETAILPLFDHIFTRVGASDYLSEGLSTFMVEMREAAEILCEAGSNSLVILDEVGRGTSTYDGMSLAQAILEFLVENKKAMTLFATHYHELTQLEARLPQVKNAHMTITEKLGEIQFLHTLVSGPANKSYGIQVACLAGLPRQVTHRARQLLKSLESFQLQQSGQISFLDMDDVATDLEIITENPLSGEKLKLIEELKELSISSITPLEALNHIAQWQKELT